MQSMWEKLALTIGSSDLIKDPRFLTNSDRLNNQDDLDKLQNLLKNITEKKFYISFQKKE